MKNIRLALTSALLVVMMSSPTLAQEIVVPSPGVDGVLLSQAIDHMLLEVEPGRILSAERTSFAERYDRDGTPVVTWHGQVPGDPHSVVVLTSKHGLTAGMIATSSGSWYLTPRPSGGHSIHHVEHEDHACATELASPSTHLPTTTEVQPADFGGQIVTIELLGIYTTFGREAVGGTDVMEVLFENAVDCTNLVMENSQVPTRFILKETVELEGAPEPDQSFTQFSFFQRQELREEWAVDLVAAIVEPEEIENEFDRPVCGYATSYGGNDRAYSSVTRRDCLGDFTFAHELGHNLGMHHQPRTPPIPPLQGLPDVAAAHYYCDPDDLRKSWRTVMTTAPSAREPLPCIGRRISRFSNPRVLFEENPTGLEDERDHALLATLTSPVVAQFRGASCIPSPTTLCIVHGRFQVDVSWETPAGESGPGRVGGTVTDNGGYFWFFSSDNPELFVKILDACTVNDRFWVFIAALTNVQVDITVTDTATGASVPYENPLGVPFVSIQDTDAFATCP